VLKTNGPKVGGLDGGGEGPRLQRGLMQTLQRRAGSFMVGRDVDVRVWNVGQEAAILRMWRGGGGCSGRGFLQVAENVGRMQSLRLRNLSVARRKLFYLSRRGQHSLELEEEGAMGKGTSDVEAAEADATC